MRSYPTCSVRTVPSGWIAHWPSTICATLWMFVTVDQSTEYGSGQTLTGLFQFNVTVWVVVWLILSVALITTVFAPADRLA